MAIEIQEDNLKQGMLGLVLALVEIITDALKLQALKRIEGGKLSDAECERLGWALSELEAALEQIKAEQGLTEAVKSVRDGFDNLVDDLLEKITRPDNLIEAGQVGV